MWRDTARSQSDRSNIVFSPIVLRREPALPITLFYTGIFRTFRQQISVVSATQSVILHFNTTGNIPLLVIMNPKSLAVSNIPNNAL
jgi:hypothetical protein